MHGEAARPILEAPERDIRVAVVDVRAADADEAVARAWPVLEKTFSRTVRRRIDWPARGGWRDVRDYSYATSPKEAVEVFASARRHGDLWCVLLVDGAKAARDRRGAQFSLLFNSLRPAGYVRESFAGKAPHRLDADRIKLLTDFVERARAATDVPGLALSLIQSGKVVFAGGFGVRERGKPARVDPDTLFMIASNTKALTTLLLAKEVDRGLFTWQTPVVEVYPAFALGDASATRQVLMKHLVCACTGMPRTGILPFFARHAEARQTFQGLANLRPTSKLGEVFQYSNEMATAAGYVGAYALSPEGELAATFAASMQRELFGPLQMRSTTLDFTRVLATPNHASPHDDDIDGHTVVVPMNLNDMVDGSPAGGVWSSAAELSRYVQLELAGGALPDGRRLISEEALLARRVPQVSMGEDQSYGMGLMIDRRSGVTLVHHGGAGLGYLSDMFWVPEAGVGGVVLTNGGRGWAVTSAFVRRVLEVLYDGELRAEDDVASSVQQHRRAVEIARRSLTIPADGAAAGMLASAYAKTGLGEIAVRRRRHATVFRFGDWESEVASRRNDDGSLSFVTIDPGGGRFELLAGTRDGLRTLTLRGGQQDQVFIEKR